MDVLVEGAMNKFYDKGIIDEYDSKREASIFFGFLILDEH